MKIQIELNNMEKSDLKWICKSLHIKCKISDTKQSIIRKLLNPMNKKYKGGHLQGIYNDYQQYNADQQEQEGGEGENLTCCGIGCFPMKTKTKRKRKIKTNNKTPLLG